MSELTIHTNTYENNSYLVFIASAAPGLDSSLDSVYYSALLWWLRPTQRKKKFLKLSTC